MMLRHSVISLVLLPVYMLLVTQARAQQRILISANRMHIAYLDIENPLTVIAEGYECETIIASCNNGTLRKGSDCKYYFRPEKEGTCDILISAKTKKGIKKVGVVTYKIKNLTGCHVAIAGKSSGRLSTEIFKVQKGLSVIFDDPTFESPLRVSKFRVTFIRGPETIYEGDNLGELFNNAVLLKMKTLKPGDRIFFENIKVMNSDGHTRSFNSIMFTLN